MRGFEEKMKSLRRAIRNWLDRNGLPHHPHVQSTQNTKLARELGLPADEVRRVLERTAADLRKLASADLDTVDAPEVIERAIHQLSKLEYQSRAIEEAAIERYVQALPERDFQILRHFKRGKKHAEIAALMDTNVESVRNSLVKTYAELRIQMMNLNDDDGGGTPVAEQTRASSFTSH